MTFVMLPVDSVITQPFGSNPTRNLAWDHPTILTYGNYQPWGHDGIDFGCWTGTPVRVPGDAIVAYSGFGVDMPYDVCIKYGFTTDQNAKWASGIVVILDHGNGIASYYAHLSRSDFDHLVGQRVTAGAILGLSGNTGRSGGPHLHWSAVRIPVNYSDGLYSRVNPLDLVSAVTVTPIAPGNTGAPPTATKPARKLLFPGSDITDLFAD